MITLQAHAAAMILEVLRFTALTSKALSVEKCSDVIISFTYARLSHLRRYHVVGNAPEMCVEQPVEKRIPEAITKGKPRHAEIYGRRNL